MSGVERWLLSCPFCNPGPGLGRRLDSTRLRAHLRDAHGTGLTLGSGLDPELSRVEAFLAGLAIGLTAWAIIIIVT